VSGVDAELRKQLVEARDVIRAQLDDLNCPHRRRAPQYLFDELEKQLCEINDLLEDEPGQGSTDSR
jgi:hypothetical protein